MTSMTNQPIKMLSKLKRRVCQSFVDPNTEWKTDRKIIYRGSSEVCSILLYRNYLLLLPLKRVIFSCSGNICLSVVIIARDLELPAGEVACGLVSQRTGLRVCAGLVSQRGKRQGYTDVHVSASGGYFSLSLRSLSAKWPTVQLSLIWSHGRPENRFTSRSDSWIAH